MSQPIFPDLPDFEDEELGQHNQELFFESKQLIKKAWKRAIEDKMTQHIKKLLDERDYSTAPREHAQTLKTLDKMKERADNIMDVKQGSNPYCFYTINFKPEKNKEDNLLEIEKELKDFTDKCKYLKESNYIYSIEQRSEENDPVDGLHVHMLFEKNSNAPSKLQRAFNNKFFDKWVGTHSALDYKYISESKVNDKIKYILGIKEKGKMAKVERDRKMKDAHGIPRYEHKGFDEQINSFKNE